MNRIDQMFERKRKEGRAALVTFVTAGDPSLALTAQLVPELESAGADLVELGFAHSDPIGEGGTIQAASERALASGTTLQQVIELVHQIRQVSEIPILLMGYLNNVLAYGEARLAADCARAGVDGLIVVDVPFDETQQLQAACEAHGVHQILLVAPTSTPERVVRIASQSRGFVYCVSVTGVTVARRELPVDLEALVQRIQRVASVPVGVGFGISTGAQAARVARIADAVVVGSALVERVAAGASDEASLRAASDFVRELAVAVRDARQN